MYHGRTDRFEAQQSWALGLHSLATLMEHNNVFDSSTSIVWRSKRTRVFFPVCIAYKSAERSGPKHSSSLSPFFA